MRRALVASLLAASVETATACPRASTTELATEVSTSDAPATTAASCVGFGGIDWRSVHRVFEVRYALGAGGTTRSGIGSAAMGFAALDLLYGLQFGRDSDEPSYEIEASASVAAQRFAGAIDATGLVTRAAVRLGPARVAARVVEDRGNIAAFPLTLELAHTGELAARPRISARPELARSLYGRERVELATRAMRIEGAGSGATITAPVATPAQKPSSWALDVIPLHAGIDLAIQHGTRFETTVGGAMIGVAEHSTGAKLDVLGVEYRRMDLSRMAALELFTVWMLKLEGVNPSSGTTYTIGWGEVVLPDELDALARKLDAGGKTPTIGGAGWFSNRSWGGWGLQYKREAFLTMGGEVGIEDRVSGELYFPRLLNLTARPFGARAQRLVGGEMVAEVTAGVELDASYAADSWSAKLGLELGRTYYTVLDGAMPETTGFVAAFGLTLQHTGGRSWKR